MEGMTSRSIEAAGPRMAHDFGMPANVTKEAAEACLVLPSYSSMAGWLVASTQHYSEEISVFVLSLYRCPTPSNQTCRHPSSTSSLLLREYLCLGLNWWKCVCVGVVHYPSVRLPALHLSNSTVCIFSMVGSVLFVFESSRPQQCCDVTEVEMRLEPEHATLNRMRNGWIRMQLALVKRDWKFQRHLRCC